MVLLTSYQMNCKNAETESEARGIITNYSPKSPISNLLRNMNGETVDWQGQRYIRPDLSGDAEILRRHGPVPLSPGLLHRRIPSAISPPRAPNPPRSLEPITRAPGAGGRRLPSPLPPSEARESGENGGGPGEGARRLRDGVGSPGPGEAGKRLAAGM